MKLNILSCNVILIGYRNIKGNCIVWFKWARGYIIVEGFVEC